MRLLLPVSLISLIAIMVMARPQAEHKPRTDSLKAAVADSLPPDSLPWKKPNDPTPLQRIEYLKCQQDSMNTRLKVIRAMLIQKLANNKTTRNDTLKVTNGRTTSTGN